MPSIDWKKKALFIGISRRPCHLFRVTFLVDLSLFFFLRSKILNLKKHPIEKENNLSNLQFWVPCEFSREGKHLRFVLLKCDLPFCGRMFVLHGRDPLTQPSLRVRSFEQPKHEHLYLIHQSCSYEETGKSKEFFLFQ